jgi:hypothetical protein
MSYFSCHIACRRIFICLALLVAAAMVDIAPAASPTVGVVLVDGANTTATRIVLNVNDASTVTSTAAGVARKSDRRYSVRNLVALHESLSNLAENVTAKRPEGHSGSILNQTREYYYLSKEINAQVICEVGFNAGHSASSFLFGSPGARYVGFDLGHMPSPVRPDSIEHGKHNYTTACLSLLRAQFADDILPGNNTASPELSRKINLVVGDSTQTVPAFAKKHPKFRCDLIHVDGGHFGNIPIWDMKNMAMLSREDGTTRVILDDAPCRIPIENKGITAGCLAPKDAWYTVRRSGAVNDIRCERYGNTRGFCVGKYTSQARAILKGINVHAPEFSSPVEFYLRVKRRHRAQEYAALSRQQSNSNGTASDLGSWILSVNQAGGNIGGAAATRGRREK